MSDLLVINKTDLAEAVGADLEVMQRDANHIRDGGPVTMAVVKHGKNVDEIVNHVLTSWQDCVPGAKINQVDDTDDKTTFNSAKDILKFVTPRWRTNYVTTDVTTPVDLYMLWKRPFVLVVGVDAPVSLRYKRHCIRAASKEASLSLEDFVEADDNLLYTCQDPPPVACNTADLSTSLASIGMNNSMETSLKAVAHLNTHKSPLSPIIPQITEKHDLNLKRVLSSANVTITNTFATVENLYEYM
ncbi:hypothetical protein IWW43_006775, partial [Coemansia sp. RSA 1935]